jgi:carbon-monoxide dehydrogenase large subunit
MQGDTDVAPYGGGTMGSRSAVIAGGVARISAIKLREKVLAIAGHMMEAAPEDLQIEDGVISVKGSPGASITFAQVAQVAHYAPDKLPEGMEPGLENVSRYNAPPATYANSTQVCKVEVDVETGQVKILDWVIGEDCGVMINPMVVEGQIAGGVAQGIGGALLEHMPYDESGNPLAITLKDYLLPTSDNVPDVRYAHVETPSATPGGHKGVGEGGAIGSPPALVNAVSDALKPLGVLITDQPVSPDRVLAAIDAARG